MHAHARSDDDEGEKAELHAEIKQEDLCVEQGIAPTSHCGSFRPLFHKIIKKIVGAPCFT